MWNFESYGLGAPINIVPGDSLHTHRSWRSVRWWLCICIMLLLITAGCTFLPSPFLVILAVALISVGLCAILRPRFALLLLVAGTGLPVLAMPLPGYTLHIVEPATILLCLAVIIRRCPLRLSISHGIAVLFLVLACISFLHVPDLSTSMDSYSSSKCLMALFIVFILFFCGTGLTTLISNTDRLFIWILVVSLPLYAIALAQALRLPLPAWLEFAGAQNVQATGGRLWGPFPWSVNFAMYLLNLFVIALVCWLRGSRSLTRFFGLVMTLVTAATMLGTGTRSVLLAMSIIVVVACIITRRYIALCWLLLIAGLSGIIFFHQAALLLQHGAISTDNRLLLWNLSIKLILDHPWIGIGLQQFPHYYTQLIVGKASELGPLGIHPHEQYLEWALESGLLWALLGILFLLSLLWLYWRAYHIAPAQQQRLLLAAFLAILANSIVGFFDVPLDQLESCALLFLLAGLAAGYASQLLYTRDKRAPYNTSISRQTFVFLRHRSSSVQQKEDVSYAETPMICTPVKRVVTTPGKALDQVSEVQITGTGHSILLQLCSWGIAVPLIFPMTALLTRYLGPTQYAEYSLTLLFLNIFALFSGTGMDPLIIRQLSQQPRARWGPLLSEVAGTRCLSTFLSVVTAIGVSFLLPIGTVQRELFLVGSCSLFFSFSCNALRIIYTHGFKAEQRIGFLAVLEASNRIITALLVGVVVWFHLSLLWGYALLVYSDLPMFLLLVSYARRRFAIRIRLNLSQFALHMRQALPLSGHDLLTLLGSQIDIVILLLLSGPSNAGVYALASRIIDPLIALSVAYVNGLYPLLCNTPERESFVKVYHQAQRVLALIIIPLAICIGAEASPLVALLGGRQFAAAVAVVPLLMGAMLLTFFNQVAERACTALHLERYVPAITLIALCANISVNLALIPSLHLVGAGIAALTGEAVSLWLFTTLLMRRRSLPMPLRTISRICLCNLPAAVLLLWLHSGPILIILPLSCMSTIVMYLLTRTLTLNDIRQLRQIILRRHAARQPVVYQPYKMRETRPTTA